MEVEVKMPDLSITEAEIVVSKWLVEAGKPVRRGQPGGLSAHHGRVAAGPDAARRVGQRRRGQDVGERRTGAREPHFAPLHAGVRHLRRVPRGRREHPSAQGGERQRRLGRLPAPGVARRQRAGLDLGDTRIAEMRPRKTSTANLTGHARPAILAASGREPCPRGAVVSRHQSAFHHGRSSNRKEERRDETSLATPPSRIDQR